MPRDIHQYENRLHRALRTLHQSSFPSANQKLIDDFHRSLFATGLSLPRVEKYVRHLLTLARWFPHDFSQASLDQVQNLLDRIQRSDYADWTKHDLRLSLKRFLAWLQEQSHSSLDPSFIRPGGGQIKKHIPRDLPTPEDIQKMIAATISPRNQAFIMLLYETGARIGEIARLCLGDLKNHPHGLEVFLPREGKTGARRVLVVSSVPYLKKWMNEHPLRHDPQAYLWPTRPSGRLLHYQAFRKILNQTAQAAGVSAKVNPHNFRHARATHLAQHLTEAQMSQFFGWVQGSDMASTYVHLSGRDVDAALLRSYGLKAGPEALPESQKLAPRKCSQCHRDNPSTHQFCGLCGLALDDQAAHQVTQEHLQRRQADALMDQLLQDDHFRDLLAQKLTQLPKQGAPAGSKPPPKTGLPSRREPQEPSPPT